MNPLNRLKEPYWESDAQYLAVIATCLPNKLDKNKEPILAELAQKYPYANIYENKKYKRKQGTYKIVGQEPGQRPIILIFSQIHSGNNDYPNDNKEKRIEWFVNALDEISELSGLKSITFPEQIARDGGGNWSLYYQCLKDFAQTIHLRATKIEISIGENPSEGSLKNVCTQISLLNCVNVGDLIPVENIRLSNVDKVSVVSSKPTLETSRQEKRRFKVNLLSLKKRQEDLKKEKDGERYYPDTPKNPDWIHSLSTQVFEQIHPSWEKIFWQDEMQTMLKEIDDELKNRLEEFGEHIRFLPEYDLIFNAFRLCPLDQLKVVILGQDPYFSNIDEPMGLSFSVPKKVKIPSSLRNIFKEINNCFDDYETPTHGDLTHWAEQGVLLLNTSLTVMHGKKGCHIDIWKNFTDRLIQLISDSAPNSIVFMLWGKSHAQKKSVLIDAKKHLILKAVHPSGLSANRGGWFNEHQFSDCNLKLEKDGLDPIDWQT